MTEMVGPMIATTAPTRQIVDCGDLPFLIKRDGEWLYRGSPITRKPMICLFSTVLKAAKRTAVIAGDAGGAGKIEVEDVPFVAVEMEWCGHGRQQVLCFRTNVTNDTAGPEHPIRIGMIC